MDIENYRPPKDYGITYFPMEQKYAVWYNYSPISTAPEWFGSKESAAEWLKNYLKEQDI